MKLKLIGVIVTTVLIAGCGGAPSETPTPTLSSGEVLQTAEAMAEMTRQAASPTPTATPVTPTATEILETPTPLATATPSQATVTANYNANVRQGPDEVYEVIDFLLQNQSARIVGRYENPVNGTWYFITREQGRDGWIWGGAVTLSGNAGVVPAFTPPPSPTPGPSATTTPSPTATSTP